MIICPKCQKKEDLYYSEPSDTITCSNIACGFVSSFMEWSYKDGSPLGDPFEISVPV